MNDWQSKDESLTKQVIAAHHVTASMQMMAVGGNPFSTQLAVMAADEIIEALAKSRELYLPYDSRIYIKDEHQNDWRNAKRRAYNFFKHADRDPGHVYDGPKVENLIFLNELQTSLNILGLRSIGHDVPKYMTEYVFLLGTFRPQYIKWDDLAAEHPNIAAARLDLPAMDHKMFLEVLIALLKKAGQLL